MKSGSRGASIRRDPPEIEVVLYECIFRRNLKGVLNLMMEQRQSCKIKP